MIAAEERLREALVRVAGDLGVGDVEVELERPRQKDHGDLSSNIAMKVAKKLGEKPRDIAAKIAGLLKLQGVGTIPDNVRIVFTPIHREEVRALVVEVRAFKPDFIAVDHHLVEFRIHAKGSGSGHVAED